MLSKVEAVFMFAIVAGLAVMIWANIVSKGKVRQLAGGSGCSCGGHSSDAAAATTVMTNPLDNL